MQTWALGTRLDANFLSQLPECSRSNVGEVCVSAAGSFQGAGGGGICSCEFVVGVGVESVLPCCPAGECGLETGFFLPVVGGSGMSVVCTQAVELDEEEVPGVAAVAS